ncbi:DUF5018 domain-containing protein [Ichthyobacterium seriolicida]|uniref:Pkd domain containing protein n=1 Tax=Ichthyobacterium seriolicida TaxID=242600 RepID=A0A1J1DXZ1_9FLAO|nr:DUF5018 domain-containing protein [Ichthyobacterium seriolicida]BAV94721.1 pkd domain containing protein [Ichthyobacterium seriolicida]
MFTVTKGDKSQEYTVYIAKESAPKLTEFKISANESKGIKGEVTAVITDDTDTATGKILLKIPYTGTAINLVGLTSVINVPEGYTIDPASGSAISESIEGKEFSLTTALGSKRVYTVEAVKGPFIGTFKFAATSGSTNVGITTEVTGTIDHIAGTISVTVPSGVTLSNLTPTIEVGENTKTDFTPSTQTDFSSNVKYIVTSSNSSATDFTKEYTVIITKALASDCSISSFELKKIENVGKIFADRVGVITEVNTITLHVSDAATLDGLTPTIVHAGASIASESPISTTENSITTTAVNYTVTAADGKTKVYAVKYIKDLSSNNRISAFAFTKDNTNNTGLKLTRSSADESRTSDIIINHEDGTIKVKVSTAADVTALTPTITKHASATISPAEGVHDYATSKTYTITAQDGQTKEYTVSVAKDLSNDKIMTSFKFEHTQNSDKSFNNVDYSAENMPSATGDDDVNVSIAKIPHTVTDLTDLKPTIVIGASATVSPASLDSQSFTRGTAVVYTVTAQDGTSRRYNVTIPVLDATSEITSFKILKTDHQSSSKISTDITISPTNSGSDYTIVLDEEDGTTITLKPEIELSAGASVSPESKQETTFTYGTAVVYTVTAENGTTKQYSVTVKSSNSKMKSFKFKAEGANQSTGKIVKDISGVINHEQKTVIINVPHDAVLDALTPNIELYNGASVSPETTTAQNFSSQKTYTVTAQDGSTSIYTVNVTKEVEPTISEFKFLNSNNSGKNLGNDITGEIKGSDIIVKVPHDATLTALVPTVTPASDVTVYKGDTGSTTPSTTSTDFSSSHSTAVKYRAACVAGGEKVYSVKVYKEPKINTFKFEKSQNSAAGFSTSPTEYVGTITNNTINVTVANTVDLASLKATITGDNIAANYVTPTALDFSSNATVTVPNQYLPEYTKEYTVTVTKEAAPQLTSFKISTKAENGIAGEVIAELTHGGADNAATGTVKLKFPKNNDNEITLTGLTPTIEPNTGGYTVSPTSGQVVSGDISANGHNIVTLTTSLGSKRVYTVETVKGPYIESFKFEDSKNSGKGIDSSTPITGVINHANNTIAITIPSTVAKDSGTDNKVSLTPTIELRGDGSPTADPASGNSQEFTSGTPVNYKVTGQDGMEKTYAVTVTRTKSTEAKIKSFAIESGQSGSISETGTGDKGRIVVPVTTLPTSSTPTITQSDYATVTPVDAQTFNSYDDSKEYTVTAEDGSTTKTYEVYIYDSTKTIASIDSLKLTDSSSADITTDSKNIDASTRTITITVPSGTTGLDSLTLTLTDTTPSSNLSIEPTSAQDFSNEKEVKYTLKESSVVKGHYWVKVVKSS